jgi:glycosyltransferase involved in cell wall biosynthesis
MHLGIDVREACAPSRTGKGQWTYGFVSELLKRDCELTLYANAPLPLEWGTLVKAHPTRLHCVMILANGIRWHLHVTWHFLTTLSVDTYVSPVSYIVPFLIGSRKCVIPVVHDLIAFQNEPHDRYATFIEKMTLRRAVFSAKKVWTVSECTKRDLLKKYPALASVDVSSVFAGPVFSHDRMNDSDGKTILCIATLCPRKNQLRLIQAFASLPTSLRHASRLVLVGKRGWDDAEIVRLAKNTSGVEWKSYLPDAECNELMYSAAVFAFPSLYEGFGLPLLDAFHVGLPVLASDRGSLKEIAADAAYLVDPESVESMRAGLERLLTDDQLRHELRKNGHTRAANFSWKRTVDLCFESLRS